MNTRRDNVQNSAERCVPIRHWLNALCRFLKILGLSATFKALIKRLDGFCVYMLTELYPMMVVESSQSTNHRVTKIDAN